MKLVLLKSVHTLGVRGAIIEVKEGYARNFLLPQKLAVSASDRLGVAKLSEKLSKLRKTEQRQADAARAVKSLEGKTFEISKKGSPSGSLYAKVTREELTALVFKKLGLSVEPEQFAFQVPPKHLGEFMVEYADGPRRTIFKLVIKRAT